ncbi:putative O-methyltransferase YrrM [Actinoalloteichus cyanogriseus DSM 43889]|uniref:O-methyltransferase YrrM n=1 Tax=Actinoalloteichus caeruleus DSM 43889 TaxID=1120930 RepID=A0ABT1JIE9_ACTCY|nr:putative O-methyltransferase YrrM [Actinoalloteichus caeruleus DSM 43889]
MYSARAVRDRRAESAARRSGQALRIRGRFGFRQGGAALTSLLVTPETPAADLSVVQDFVADYLAEDEVLAAARARGVALGCEPISPGSGAALRFLASSLRARAVVEVGSGAGVSGLWLLRGMLGEGVLTSIDFDPENQRAARKALAEAGVAAGRARLITGRGLDVLPRLTDGGYDLVFVESGWVDYASYLEEGLRLLRDGGVLAFGNLLRIAAAGGTQEEHAGLRQLTEVIRVDPRLVPFLLPFGEGLLIAAKRDVQ